MFKLSIPYKHNKLVKSAVPGIKFNPSEKCWYATTQEDADAVARVLSSLNGLPVPAPSESSMANADFKVEQILTYPMLEQYLAQAGYSKVAATGSYRVFAKGTGDGGITRNGAIVVYQVKPSHFEVASCGAAVNMLCREDVIAYTDNLILKDLDEALRAEF